MIHAHARARWTGRTLRVEIEGWVDPGLAVRDSDALGRLIADEISCALPEASSFTWTTWGGTSLTPGAALAAGGLLVACRTPPGAPPGTRGTAALGVLPKCQDWLLPTRQRGAALLSRPGQSWIVARPS